MCREWREKSGRAAINSRDPPECMPLYQGKVVRVASLALLGIFLTYGMRPPAQHKPVSVTSRTLAFAALEPLPADLSRGGSRALMMGSEDKPQSRKRKLVTPVAVGALVAASTTAVMLRRPGPHHAPPRLVELSAAMAGGLLSSSCCVVQLALNSLSIGCAGFAVLDKFRPFFLTLTFSSLAFKTWYYDVRLRRGVWRSIPTWLIALSLAASPHAVRWLNRYSLKREAAVSNTYRVHVQGMKCEACAHGLKTELDQLQGVRTSSVLFSEGLVVVEGNGDEDRGALLGRIHALMDAKNYGYSSSPFAEPVKGGEDVDTCDVASGAANIGA